MGITDFTLYQLARRWPSPVKGRIDRLGAEPCSTEYGFAYALDQFKGKLLSGLHVNVIDLDVLEVGCGHGGISCFMAVVGAKNVIGIDLDESRLAFARRFAFNISSKFGVGYNLPVSFYTMDAEDLTFPDASFDLVIADNAFEHFNKPENVLKNIFRVLRPGGLLNVPIFSSIYSKHGLHLKHGLKIPWANLFFSEKTIIRTMYRLSKDNSKLFEWYPGLSGNPENICDLRKYRDLNNLTYSKFKSLALTAGFQIQEFSPRTTFIGKLIYRIPGLQGSVLVDVFSKGASARLYKP